MNYWDILLLLPLLYGIYKGFSKGLIVEMATLVGLLLGSFLAVRFSGYMERILQDYMTIPPKYLYYAALTITFLLVMMGVYVLGKLLTKIAEGVALGMINKLLGALFGLVKYFVFVGVILLIIDALDDKFQFISKETRDNSLLFNPFLNFAQRIYHLIRF